MNKKPLTFEMLGAKLRAERYDRKHQPLWKDILTHFLRSVFVKQLKEKCFVVFNDNTIHQDLDNAIFYINRSHLDKVVEFLKGNDFLVCQKLPDQFEVYLED